MPYLSTLYTLGISLVYFRTKMLQKRPITQQLDYFMSFLLIFWKTSPFFSRNVHVRPDVLFHATSCRIPDLPAPTQLPPDILPWS